MSQALRRLDRMHLALHGALLLIVMVLVALWVDVQGAVFDADEGAQLLQIQILDERDSWFVDYPAIDVDPDMEFVPLRHARRLDDQIAPFPVRPALTAVTRAAWQAGGVLGATIPGLLGLVVAASVAADLARRMEPRARLLAFWIAGLGSPLAFHALELRGHGITTGLAAASAWFVVTAEERSLPVRWLGIVAPFVTVGAGVLIRREVLLFALALGVAAAIDLARFRKGWRALSASAGVLGGVVGLMVNRTLENDLFEVAARSAPAAGADSFVTERIQSLLTTLSSGYPGDPATAALLAALAMAIAAIAAIRYFLHDDSRAFVLTVSAAAVVLVARLLVGPQYVIQGLIPAFPFAVLAGLLAVRWRNDRMVQHLATSGLAYAALIIATQYRVAGGYEWGNRYLAPLVPLMTAIGAVAIVRTMRQVELTLILRRLLVASLTVIVAVPALMGFIAQREVRATNTRNLQTVHDLAVDRQSDLVISTHTELPRVDTEHFDRDARYLWVPIVFLERGVRLLDEAGYSEVVLTTRDPDGVQIRLRDLGWTFRPITTEPTNPGTMTTGILTKD